MGDSFVESTPFGMGLKGLETNIPKNEGEKAYLWLHVGVLHPLRVLGTQVLWILAEGKTGR